MSDQKPGFLKRLFRFGKKKEPDEAVVSDPAPASPSGVEQQAAAEKAAQAEQQRLADEAEAKRVAEEERAEREHARKEAEEQAQCERDESERIAAEEANRLAAEKAAEQERQRQEEDTRLAAEKAEQEAQAKAAQAFREQEEEETRRREQAEREAAEEEVREKAEAERTAREEAERQRAQAEQARQQEEARLAAKQAEDERLAAERFEQERRAAEEERLAREAAEREAAEKEAAEAEKQRLTEEREARQEVAEDRSPEPASGSPDEEPRPSWFKRLRGGLARSSNQLTESITGVFTKRKLDEDTLQDLEDILIRADLGVETAMSITDKLAAQRMGKDISSEEVRGIMAEEIETVLDPVAAELELDLDYQPHVILVVGVNGSGKTTTIGKLSQKLYDAGFSTLLVAGDTFRAAAIEQLKIWGERTQSPVLSRPLGSDAAGLAFDAYEQAKAEGRDVMLMDTAGRLQNRTELMDELAKIVRVLKKQDPAAPHTVLLTLDATTGQNALNQVEIFKDVAGVNGIVMTKLDGTARGGILVAISAKHKLPVFFLGVGEQVDDLEPFEARDFARSIAGLEI